MHRQRLTAKATVVALVTIVAIATTAGPATAAVGDITTYRDPAGGANQPFDITAGPDGNLWFTATNNPTAVGRIDPDTAVITTYHDPAKLGSMDGITTGPDGNIWFNTHFGIFGETGAFVGRIDVDDGAITTFQDPVSLAGQNIVTGPDGNLWFTAFTDRIVRFKPGDSSFTNFTDPNVQAPGDIVVGPDGNLWFPSTDNDRIGRIDPDDGTITTFTDPAGNVASPFGITLGADGNLWFTNTNARPVGRIDPDDGSITTFPDPAGSVSGPLYITVGPDGNLWFTSFLNGRIGRFDPDDQTYTTFSDPAGNVDRPTGIAAGADGNLWFTDQTTDRIGVVELTTPPPTVPGAPTGVVAVAIASGVVQVRFVPPADDGGSPILNYRATCTDGGVPVTASGDGSPINVTGLTNGVTYQCTVTAENAAGFGAESSLPATVRVGVPYGPTIVKAAPGAVSGSIKLDWNTAQGNGAPVSSYTATCTPAETYPGMVPKSVTVGSGVRTTTITGLFKGRSYHCFVAARNSRGTGPTFAASPLVVKAKP